MSNLSQPLRFAELSISYKPFISLTKMLGLSDENPALQGMVNYAGSMTFELHQPESSTQEAFVRLGVKNGTEEAGYTYYNMLDTENITLSKLQSSMSGYTLNDLSSWCHACGNTDSRGCQTIAAANETWSNNAVADGQSLSPLAAGFIGASVTFAVLVALFAGFLAKQSTKRRKQASNFAAAGGVKDSSSSNTSVRYDSFVRPFESNNTDAFSAFCLGNRSMRSSGSTVPETVQQKGPVVSYGLEGGCA